jgi:hypothetical protein
MKKVFFVVQEIVSPIELRITEAVVYIQLQRLDP